MVIETTSNKEGSVRLYCCEAPALGELLSEDRLSDLDIVVCGGRRLRAHRSRLASVSPLMAQLFGTSEAADTLLLPDFSYFTVQQLLHFLHSGFVRLAGDELESVLQLATLLGVRPPIDVEPTNPGQVRKRLASNNAAPQVIQAKRPRPQAPTVFVFDPMHDKAIVPSFISNLVTPLASPAASPERDIVTLMDVDEAPEDLEPRVIPFDPLPQQYAEEIDSSEVNAEEVMQPMVLSVQCAGSNVPSLASLAGRASLTAPDLPLQPTLTSENTTDAPDASPTTALPEREASTSVGSPEENHQSGTESWQTAEAQPEVLDNPGEIGQEDGGLWQIATAADFAGHDESDKVFDTRENQQEVTNDEKSQEDADGLLEASNELEEQPGGPEEELCEEVEENEGLAIQGDMQDALDKDEAEQVIDEATHGDPDTMILIQEDTDKDHGRIVTETTPMS